MSEALENSKIVKVQETSSLNGSIVGYPGNIVVQSLVLYTISYDYK